MFYKTNKHFRYRNAIATHTGNRVVVILAYYKYFNLTTKDNYEPINLYGISQANTNGNQSI